MLCLTVFVKFWLMWSGGWAILGKKWVRTKLLPSSYQVATKLGFECFWEKLTNLLKWISVRTCDFADKSVDELTSVL